MALLLLATIPAHASPRPIGGWRQAEVPAGRPSTVNCTWKNFTQTLDHFGSAKGTFPQRYCVYSKWWRDAAYGGFNASAGAPGPILFYTGNEANVELCAPRLEQQLGAHTCLAPQTLRCLTMRRSLA